MFLAQSGDMSTETTSSAPLSAAKTETIPAAGAHLEKVLACEGGKAVHGEFCGPIIFRTEHSEKNPDGFAPIRNVIGTTMPPHQPNKYRDLQRHLPPYILIADYRSVGLAGKVVNLLQTTATVSEHPLAPTKPACSFCLHRSRIPDPGGNEVVQLIIFPKRKPLRHRLNALAIARADQTRYVQRTHLSPRLSPNRSRNGLSQRPSSSFQSNVLPTMVGPSNKPTTHEIIEKLIWES